jgi:putative Mg2+ transporter-C (MgtC) family protein
MLPIAFSSSQSSSASTASSDRGTQGSASQHKNTQITKQENTSGIPDWVYDYNWVRTTTVIGSRNVPGSRDFIIRLVVALILGFSLGLERELTNKYAGLRTHILVCLGACVFTLLSIYGFPTFADGDNVIIDQATGVRDTARIAAQIVTGIGFIGAGTVLRNGPMVFGLTTAATLWIAARIGMACGAGMYDVAVISTILSVAVLTIIRVFERQFLPTSGKQMKRFKITIYCDGEDVKKVYEYLIAKVDSMTDFSAKKLIENTKKSKISTSIELCNKKIIDEIYDSLSNMIDTDSISLQELND